MCFGVVSYSRRATWLSITTVRRVDVRLILNPAAVHLGRCVFWYWILQRYVGKPYLLLLDPEAVR